MKGVRTKEVKIRYDLTVSADKQQKKVVLSMVDEEFGRVDFYLDDEETNNLIDGAIEARKIVQILKAPKALDI
jgi:hypothetical protein